MPRVRTSTRLPDALEGPDKGAGELFESFWWEFEAILKAAGEDEAHFEGFSFPNLTSWDGISRRSAGLKARPSRRTQASAV